MMAPASRPIRRFRKLLAELGPGSTLTRILRRAGIEAAAELAPEAALHGHHAALDDLVRRLRLRSGSRNG